MADHVRLGDRPGDPCRHRALVRHGEPALAGVERPDRTRGESHHPTAQAQPAVPQERVAGTPGRSGQGQGRRRSRDLCGVVQEEKPSRDDPGFGSMVLAGPGRLRHRHLHTDDSGRGHRQGVEIPRPGRHHPQRHAGRQGLGHDGHAVRLGRHHRHLPGGPSRPDQTANLGLHRLRGGNAAGRTIHPPRRQQRHVVALPRFHAVLLHGQLRAERHDVSACGRGLPHRGAGQGRRFRRVLRQDRCGVDGVPVPHPAEDHRDNRAAVGSGRRASCWEPW